MAKPTPDPFPVVHFSSPRPSRQLPANSSHPRIGETVMRMCTCRGTLRSGAFIGVCALRAAAAPDPLAVQPQSGSVSRQGWRSRSHFRSSSSSRFWPRNSRRAIICGCAPLDRNAYLVYPPQTRFHQKHAEFFGRLRGKGVAKVRLSYESVTENLDGSRHVDVRQGDIEIPIPAEATGSRIDLPAMGRAAERVFSRSADALSRRDVLSIRAAAIGAALWRASAPAAEAGPARDRSRSRSVRHSDRARWPFTKPCSRRRSAAGIARAI